VKPRSCTRHRAAQQNRLRQSIAVPNAESHVSAGSHPSYRHKAPRGRRCWPGGRVEKHDVVAWGMFSAKSFQNVVGKKKVSRMTANHAGADGCCAQVFAVKYF
jgi:hypothetical protein